jgi:hypothetical protein
VNYFSHLWVVGHRRQVPAPVTLGVVLPDVLAMAGLRADHTRLPLDVGIGRDAHHRGDHLFHHHPVFLQLVRDLRRALADAGLAAGPAHAVAHAGNELLLDGTLAAGGVTAAHRPAGDAPGRDQLVETFTDALGCGDLVHGALRATDRPRFDEVLRRTAQDRPERLADPGAVADRLYRVVGRRPRLSFPAEQTATVARVLATHRPSVVSAGAVVLHDVAEGLADLEIANDTVAGGDTHDTVADGDTHDTVADGATAATRAAVRHG